MASTTVPEIAYRFLADNADALKKNKETKESIEKINDIRLVDIDLSVTKLATSVKGLLPTLSAAAVAGFTHSAIQAAAAVGTAADRAQLAVGEFGRLQYVAEQADVNFGELTGALKDYRAGIDDAEHGQGNLRLGLDRLNLSMSDLRDLGIEQQLALISDRFRQVTDPTQRAAIAQDLFNKSGQAMIPLLLRGGTELQRLGDEAERLGLVFDQRAVVGADRFTKALDRLTQAAKVNLGGALGSLFADVFGTGDELADTEARLQRLQGLAESFLKNPNPATTALLAPTLLAISQLTERLEELQRQASTAAAEAFRYGEGPNFPWLDRVQEVNVTARKIKEEDEYDKVVRAFREKREQEELERENRRIDRAVEFRKQLERAVIDGEKNTSNEVERELQRRSETEEYARQQSRDREQELQETLTDFRRNSANAAVTLLTAYGGKYKTFAKAILAVEKAHAIAKTIISTKAAAAAALEYYGPTPWGYAAAAAAIAFGVAQVAAIASTFIGGGSSVAGSPHNPIFVDQNAQTSPGTDTLGTPSPQGGQRVVQIVIQGNVYSGRETADFLFQQISQRINEYDAVIIQPTSRQARELQSESAA